MNYEQLRVELAEKINAEMVQWDALQCMLCARKFKTAEILGKHVDISDLHKVCVLSETGQLNHMIYMEI